MEDHDLIGKATSASEENTTNEVYRKVTFEVVFSTALVDSYLIYKENYPASKAAILQFRESCSIFTAWYTILQAAIGSKIKETGRSNQAKTR